MTDTELEQRLAALLAGTAGHPVDTERGWREFAELRSRASQDRRRKLGAVAFGAAAVVAAAAAIPLVAGGPSGQGTISVVPPNHRVTSSRTPSGYPGGIRAYPGAITARIGVSGVVDVVQDGTALFAVRSTTPAGDSGYQLVKIDLPSSQVTLRVNLGHVFKAVAAAGGRLWLTTARSAAGGQVVRLDPVTGKVIATVHLAAGHCGYLTFSGGRLWAECGSGRFDSTFFLLDPVTGRVEAQLGPVRGPIGQIAVTPLGVWYLTSYSGVSAILASNGASPGPRKITVRDPAYLVSFSYAQSLVYSRGAIWVLTNDESVAKIDPVTGHVERIYTYRSYDPAYNGGLDFLTTGQGSLWFLDDGYPFGGVLRVSMSTGRPLGGVPIKPGSCGQPCWQIYDTGGLIWVPTLASLLAISPAGLPG
jgi:hypothetical protein